MLDKALSWLGYGDGTKIVYGPNEVDGLTDEEIIKHMGPNRVSIGSTGDVYAVLDDAAVKRISITSCDASEILPVEATMLNFVREHTSIPVPRVHRVIKNVHGSTWIVMNRIKGRTVASAWGSLSLWSKICIAFTLRRYVRQLNRIQGLPMTHPGAPSSTGPQECDGPLIESGYGYYILSKCFDTYEDLAKAFNEERLSMFHRRPNMADDHPFHTSPFDTSPPLVLSHQDLNPRNLILDDTNRLWVIDWEWGGYYPAWFEFVAMQMQAENEKNAGWNGQFWDPLAPFVCGPYFKHEKWYYGYR